MGGAARPARLRTDRGRSRVDGRRGARVGRRDGPADRAAPVPRRRRGLRARHRHVAPAATRAARGPDRRGERLDRHAPVRLGWARPRPASCGRRALRPGDGHLAARRTEPARPAQRGARDLDRHRGRRGRRVGQHRCPARRRRVRPRPRPVAEPPAAADDERDGGARHRGGVDGRAAGAARKRLPDARAAVSQRAALDGGSRPGRLDPAGRAGGRRHRRRAGRERRHALRGLRRPGRPRHR